MNRTMPSPFTANPPASCGPERDPHPAGVRSTCRVLGSRIAMIFAVAAAGAMLFIGGCDQSTGNSSGSSSAPKVTEATYKIPTNVKGTPIDDVASFITINDRIMNARLSTDVCSQLDLTDQEPKKIIQGHQIFQGKMWHQYIASRNLQVREFLCPPDAKIVQVDVSLDKGFPLKSLTSEERSEYVPAPMLHDNIGNTYWPIGYVLTDPDNDTLEINIDLDRQFKDLNRIPGLSRSKKESMILLFRVTNGVTLTGISYGGNDLRTFNLPTKENG